MKLICLFIFVLFVTTACTTEENPATDDGGQNDSNTESVQARLDAGETPISIYLSNPETLIDIIGSNFQGGIIFYLDTDTGEGLITTPFDIAKKAYGACAPFETPDLGDSQINGGAYVLADLELYTNYYVENCTIPGSAAQLCADFVQGGYDDWFLPDLQTMIHMGSSQVVPNLQDQYWCANVASFELRNQVYDWSTNFKYLPSIDFTNQSTFAVRPARYFNSSASNGSGNAVPNTVAEKLASLSTPWELLDEGVSREMIYGEYYDGGLITYLNEDARTGIVVGLHFLKWEMGGIPLYEWGCYEMVLNDPNGNGTNGSGLYNTLLIANSGCSVTQNNTSQPVPAANDALQYSTNHNLGNLRYDDWYLPNITELGYYNNLFLSTNAHLMISGHYWSSNTLDPSFSALAILYPFNEQSERRRDASATIMIPARDIAE